MKMLGAQFDIHGGGLDLQFPHHENEIAQSEGATGHPFANYWMHVGMLQVNQEKMAKSTGNFFTIRDVLKKYHPEVVRYFLLSNHYRSPLNYSEENLNNARKALMRLYQTLKGVAITPEKESSLETRWVEQFNAAMNDDFNTPEALAVLFNLSHEVNKTNALNAASTLYYLAKTLGILQEDPEAFLQSSTEGQDLGWVEKLLEERQEARNNKDWARADEIRQILSDKEIEIEDGKHGTTWRYK